MHEEIFNQLNSKKSLIFFGAGISLNSGVPLAQNLVSCILNNLDLSEEEIQVIRDSSLPFEAFIECLTNGSEIDPLLDIFDFGEPNTNHIFFAKLARRGIVKRFCTTNFDTLLEKAFVQEGLKRGKDYIVIYKNNELVSIDWNDDRTIIIKLHGSIKDKSNIAITIQAVANKALAISRQETIREIFSKGIHDSVFIYGYSCSDIFDISPQIKKIARNKKKVILIEHTKNRNNQEVSEFVSEDIRIKKNNNPFKSFEGSIRLNANTDIFIKRSWEILITDNHYVSDISKDRYSWKNNVIQWLGSKRKDIELFDKGLILGSIFLNISHFSLAKKHLNSSLESISANSNKAKVLLLEKLAIVNTNICEYKSALKYNAEALHICNLIKEHELEAKCFGNMGIIYNYIGEYRNSIFYLEKAISILQSGNYNMALAVYIDALGVVYNNLGDFEKSIAHHLNALQLSKETGNLRNEEIQLGHLGMAYMKRRDIHKAIDFCQRALELSRHLGDIRDQGIHLGNLGEIVNFASDYAHIDALNYLTKALDFSRDVGDKRIVSKHLLNLGIYYYKKHEDSYALRCYAESLEISKTIGDKHNEAKCLGYMGVLYKSIDSYIDAQKYQEDCLFLLKSILFKDHPDILMFNSYFNSA